MTAITPLSFPEVFDVIVVTGRQSPGTARIIGAHSPRKWDEQKGTGQSGAWLKFTGDGLGKFKVALELADDDDWADWASWKELVRKPANGKPGPLDIYHPILEEHDIKSVVVLDVAGPEPQGDDGLWVVVIEFQTWSPPKPAAHLPKGSKASPTKPTPPTAQDEYDLVIANLTAQVKELAK